MRIVCFRIMLILEPIVSRASCRFVILSQYLALTTKAAFAYSGYATVATSLPQLVTALGKSVLLPIFAHPDHFDLTWNYSSCLNSGLLRRLDGKKRRHLEWRAG
jgi:hypothetical protein